LRNSRLFQVGMMMLNMMALFDSAVSRPHYTALPVRQKRRVKRGAGAGINPYFLNTKRLARKVTGMVTTITPAIASLASIPAWTSSQSTSAPRLY